MITEPMQSQIEQDQLVLNRQGSGGDIAVFDAVTGEWLRSVFAGPGGLTGCMWDSCIATTGPNNETELFVSDRKNHRVKVCNPWTGAYIRHIGQGEGEGNDAGQLSHPRGLVVQAPSTPGGEYLLYVLEGIEGLHENNDHEHEHDRVRMLHPRDINWMQRRSIALLRDAIVTMYAGNGDQSEKTSNKAIRVWYNKRFARNILSFLGLDVSSVGGLEIPLPRGPGSIGVGHLKVGTQGKVDIVIPVGGTVADAVMFVPEYAGYAGGKISLFNAITGAWVGSIGNGKGSGPGQFGRYIFDVCIATTGPNHETELFVADSWNHRVSVYNPWTGTYIRHVGQGMGNDAGQLSYPRGLVVQAPSAPGGEYLLYVTETDNHRVQVFNAITGSHLRCIGAGKGSGPGQLHCPFGVAVLCPGQGNGGGGDSLEIFVSDYFNRRVSVFDSTTGVFLRHVGVGQLICPMGVAVSLTGAASQGGDYLLFVCEKSKHGIEVFNARTGAHVGLLGVGLLNEPHGLKIYPGFDGKFLLLVSNDGSNKVEVLEIEV